jgi:WD40 repeat protein
MAPRVFLAISVVVWAFYTGPAAAQQTNTSQPPQEPILRIDPGMHTSTIFRIGVDATCKLLATASVDKTVRLWRLPDGKPLRTLRLPIGPGNEGKIYAVAVSSDGKWIAAGGRDPARSRLGGDFVYIVEAASGAVRARLGPLGGSILGLVVSPDGRYLAATLHRGQGLRVWKRAKAGLADWRLVGEDKDYGGKPSYGAAFGSAGMLYTVADDGKLRRYAAGYGAKPTWVATRSKRPSTVAVHPAGDRVAIGFEDTPAVEVYSGKLAWRFPADTKNVDNGNLSSVAWAADGTRLYAGGRFNKDGINQILIWDMAGAGSAKQVGSSQNTVQHMVPCGGGIAVGAQDPAFGLLKRDGSPRFWRNAVQADLRGLRGDNELAVSADGRRVRFGLKESGNSLMLFDLAAESVGEMANLSAELFGPDTTSLPITGWANTGAPKIGQTLLKLSDDDLALSLAIAPDKQSFVLGAEWGLRGYDMNGTVLWYKQVPGASLGVNISRNGKLVVAAYGDGTIRWHRLQDGQELLALFIHAKDRRWVAWTPKGYFMASAGGEDLIGWHVNRGWDETADFFPVSQFRDQFYRPDIVARVLTDLDEERAIAEANRIRRKAREDEDIRKRQPPVLRILSPADESSIASDEVKIEYSLRSPSGAPIKRFFAQIDGNLTEGQVAALPAIDGTGEMKGILTVKLPLRSVTVSVTAETDRAFDTQRIRLIRKSAIVDRDPLPNLYAMVIGVAKYANLPELSFADDDALAVADLLARQEGPTYASVKIKLFTTRENRGSAHEEAAATIANVKKGLNWLQAMRRDADGRVLFYFSGHGQTKVEGSSFLLPADFDPTDYVDTALSKSHLLDVLTRRGRVFLFIDACHAAGALADVAQPLNSRDFVNGAAAISGSWVFAFSSSLATQPSFGTRESKSFFTRALVQGLRGDAAARGERIILTGDLDVWLHRQVGKQSAGEQVAVMHKSPAADHVPVAILPP